MEATKRKRGRPRKHPADLKQTNLTFRTPGGLRDLIAGAAEKSHRSMSEEVTHRLWQSFDRHALSDEIVHALRRVLEERQ
jgi:hypothetical protein